MSFTTEYLGEAKAIIDRLDPELVERIARILADGRSSGGRLFIVGVGGGAGHASHAVCDFRKVAGIEAYTPSDNVSELTARINDDGWRTSYRAWLEVSRISSRDVLFVLSVGGGDPERNVSGNLVAAVELARDVGAKVIGVVGRDGGYTAAHADACVIIPPVSQANVTAHTESFQALIWHLLVAHPLLRANEMKWESIH